VIDEPRVSTAQCFEIPNDPIEMSYDSKQASTMTLWYSLRWTLWPDWPGCQSQ